MLLMDIGPHGADRVGIHDEFWSVPNFLSWCSSPHDGQRADLGSRLSPGLDFLFDGDVSQETGCEQFLGSEGIADFALWYPDLLGPSK
jgi:hypothetical protein